MFSQLDAASITAVRMLHLKVLAVNLVYIVCGSNMSALSQTEAFVGEFRQMSGELSDSELTGDPFLTELDQNLTSSENKPGAIARILRPLLVKHPLVPLRGVNRNMAMAHAVIHEPSGSQETPHKYTAGLVLGVNMDCEITNVRDISTLR